jgi:5'-nucleotidase
VLAVTGLWLAAGAWTGCGDDDGDTNDNNINNNNNVDPEICDDQIDNDGDGDVDCDDADCADDPACQQTEYAQLTVVSTSDIHNHALGYGPLLDEGTPHTSGGFARLATVIGTIRATQEASGIPVVVVDSGDWTMGTVFDFATENPIALQFFANLQYDAITWGNHEFDWGPAGLAMLLDNHATNALPGTNPVPILAANTVFDSQSSEDDALEAVAAQMVSDSLVLDLANGLRVGLFGAMGETADEDAATAAPVTFDHEVSTYQAVVDDLRNEQGVDLVILISHGGVEADGSGDDADLAQAVTGIDIIASGHAHTATADVIVPDGTSTYIFEPGAYSRHVSQLDVTYNVTDGEIDSVGYQMHAVDHTVTADASTQALVGGYMHAIDQVLIPALGTGTASPVAELDFDLSSDDYTPVVGPSPLGYLVTDAMRTISSLMVLSTAEATPFDVAVLPKGLLRDSLYAGDSHTVTFADLFRVVPLGVTPDSQQAVPIGWPLVSMYLTGPELRNVAEVSESLAPMAGASAYLHLSGVRYSVDPAGGFLQTVDALYLCGTALPAGYGGDEDYYSLSCPASAEVDLNDTTTLYRLVVDVYTVLVMGIAADYGLTIAPKDAAGNPIDLGDMSAILAQRIDADPATAGVQELKEWVSLLFFVWCENPHPSLSCFIPDTDSNGLGEIPSFYDVAGAALNRDQGPTN